MEKNHPSSGFIKDQSRGPRVSGLVLWGPVIPAPVVITSLLLSLYSILTIYCVLLCMSVMQMLGGWLPSIENQKYFLTICCVLLCMSVMHDALGRIEYKANKNEVITTGAGMMAPHSTC